MFLLYNLDLFECAAGVLTSFQAGHAEEDHGGKEWGKSAAQIRKRHKDGRCMAFQSQTETNKRFDSRAGRRPGAANSSARGISPTREQLITINHQLIYLSKRLGLRARLFLSAAWETQSTSETQNFLRPRVCRCVRTALFIVQAGYSVFPGEKTQQGSRKRGTSQRERGGRQRADSGSADNTHAGSQRNLWPGSLSKAQSIKKKKRKRPIPYSHELKKLSWADPGR